MPAARNTGPRRRLAAGAASLLVGAIVVNGAAAHPDEVAVRRVRLPTAVKPLLVVVADTSAAMDARIATRRAYDPARDYAPAVASSSRCDATRVYWRRGPGPAPACGSGQSVPLRGADARHGLGCEQARAALTGTGLAVVARLAQWEPRPAGGWWREPRSGSDAVLECRADRGLHGGADGDRYAQHGAADPWSATASAEIDWQSAPLGDSYVLYAGNFLNYLQAEPADVDAAAIAVLRNGLGSLASIGDELDLALLRPSHDGGLADYAGEGGYLLLAAGDDRRRLGTIAADIAAAGPAPLGETLAEAAAYLAGAPVIFGDSTHAAPGTPAASVDSARLASDPTHYASPFEHACRPATLALVTAGAPSADEGARLAASRVEPLASSVATCRDDCVTTLLNTLESTDLRPDQPGTQRVAPLVVGAMPAALAMAQAAEQPWLDLADPLAFANLAAYALANDAAVPAPAVYAAMTFVPGASEMHLGWAVTAVAAPELRLRWRGNARRFAVAAPSTGMAAPELMDRNQRPAVDPATGQLADGAEDFWDSGDSRPGPLAGGAASQLPAPAERLVVSNLAPGALLAPANRVERGNPDLARALAAAGVPPSRDDALTDWLRGSDSLDGDRDGNTSESRQDMGSAARGAPVTVSYAADGPRLLFVATGDGILHAIDAASGGERWAFVPRQLLAQSAAFDPFAATPGRMQGIDGELRVQVVDANRDGRITRGDGDQAWLAFGLGHGGRAYLALDITDPDEPRLAWSLGPDDLPLLGLATATPVFARLPVAGAGQNPGRWVVALAGGTDPADDSTHLPAAAAGNALYLVDAASGDVLWTMGGTSLPGVDRVVTSLRHALPAAPRLLDLDGDGRLDHAYVADARGGIWRLDFRPGEQRADLVVVSQFAALEGGDPPRRFDVEPDVALARGADGRRYLAVSLGSGWRARPFGAAGGDRFYSLRDYRLQSLDSAAAEAATPVREDDLEDVTGTAVATTTAQAGWLARLDGDGPGERAVGRSNTFAGVIRVPTWRPLDPSPAEPCGPPRGRSRLRSFNLVSGRPVHRVDETASDDDALESEFGWPMPAAIALPPAPAGCRTAACRSGSYLLRGFEWLPLDFRNDPVRTTWRELDAGVTP